MTLFFLLRHWQKRLHVNHEMVSQAGGPGWCLLDATHIPPRSPHAPTHPADYDMLTHRDRVVPRLARLGTTQLGHDFSRTELPPRPGASRAPTHRPPRQARTKRDELAMVPDHDGPGPGLDRSGDPTVV